MVEPGNSGYKTQVLATALPHHLRGLKTLLSTNGIRFPGVAAASEQEFSPYPLEWVEVDCMSIRACKLVTFSINFPRNIKGKE